MSIGITRTIAVATAFCLTGCTYPFIKPASDLAATLQKGDSSISTLMDAEAKTFRVYKHVSPLVASFKVSTPDQLSSAFVAEVCRPYAPGVLTPEHVAIDNMEKFRATLAAASAEQKDQSLTALVSSLSKSRTSFHLQDPEQAAAEYEAQELKKFERCADDVRKTFTYSPPAGALGVAALISAWPKVKEFLTFLLTEANKKKSDEAIRAFLANPEIAKSIDDSLTELSKSSKDGDLYVLFAEEKQLILWSAYYYFVVTNDVSKNESTVGAFGFAYDLANQMQIQMAAYNSLSGSNPSEVLAAMQKPLARIREAAKSGKVPDDTVVAELLASFDFLSDAYTKADAVASAFTPKATPSKPK